MRVQIQIKGLPGSSKLRRFAAHKLEVALSRFSHGIQDATIRLNEIVHVLTPAFLVNSARQACRYETADGGRMAPGYYLALCASGMIRLSYGRGGRFFGPFTTLAEARFLQTSAAALGIIDMAVPVPAAPAHGFDDRRSHAVRGEVPGVLSEQNLVRGAATGYTGFFNSSNDPDRRRAGRKGSATRSTDSIGRASQQSC